MTYSRSKKLTEAEKRLQALRSQLYGKEKDSSSPTQVKATFTAPAAENKTEAAVKPPAEVNYLRSDLLKTTILASIIIGAQLVLYFSLQKI
ncbi:MAG: hypothetical protein Q7S44_04520 [bacterium]|nr:hypothetical protein [bacterium]